MNADDAPKYRKRPDDGQTLAYMPPDAPAVNGPFLLRISLGDMALSDAFYAPLPPDAARLTLGELLERYFGEDPGGRQEMLNALDVEENPDLPDMHGEVTLAWSVWRDGGIILRWYANNGPPLELGDAVADHLNFSTDGAATLDLVLESSMEPLAWWAEEAGDDKDGLLRWMQGRVLLYFMDKHEYGLPAEPSDDPARRLLPIAEELREQGLIAPDEGGVFTITPEGRAHLGEQIAETEDYIDRYDVFASVLYDNGAKTAEFGGRRGGFDLRANVYAAEGLAPMRVVFLLRLYDGTLDDAAGEWRDAIHDEVFYDTLLMPALDRDTVDGETLDWLIEAGLAHAEEQAEQERERRADRDAMRRALG